MRIGKLPENVYRRSVWKELKYRREEVKIGAGALKDCAILSLKEETDLVAGMVSVTGKTGSIGKRAVHKAVNHIAALGTEPIAVMGSLLLPEETPEETLKQIVRQIGQTCESLGVEAADLDVTTVSRHQVEIKENCGIITMNAVGGRKRQDQPAVPRPGQDILVSKWVGLEGTYLLAGEKKKELCRRFSGQYIETAEGFDRYLSIIPEAATAMKSGAGAMRHVSEGGIYAALWEMAESAGVGLEIELKKIPIRQETVEICNYFDLNPYALSSEGCLLMASDRGDELAEELQGEGIPAVVIGRATAGNDRLILNEEEKRFLTPAQPDELYKMI